MSLLDTESATLSLRVKRSEKARLMTRLWVFNLLQHLFVSRAPPGFVSLSLSAPSAPPFPSRCAAIISPAVMPSGVTSPPDSEAYDGETDSDADTQALAHRRQRRTPPHARSPARYDNQDEEETSEMSGSVTPAAASTILLFCYLNQQKRESRVQIPEYCAEAQRYAFNSCMNFKESALIPSWFLFEGMRVRQMQVCPCRVSGRACWLVESPSRSSGRAQNTPQILTHSHRHPETRHWWRQREKGTAASRRRVCALGSPAHRWCLQNG